MKCLIMYMDTENMIRMVKKKIKDGVIKIKKKSFAVDKVKPYLFETKFLFQKKITPLYIVKHNNAIPYRFEFDEKKLKAAVTPENYSKLMEQGALRELLSVKGSEMKDYLMWLVMGAAMGGMLGYILAGMV